MDFSKLTPDVKLRFSDILRKALDARALYSEAIRCENEFSKISHSASDWSRDHPAEAVPRRQDHKQVLMQQDRPSQPRAQDAK